MIEGLGAADLADHARVIVEKPFGRDLASARDFLKDPRNNKLPNQSCVGEGSFVILEPCLMLQ